VVEVEEEVDRTPSGFWADDANIWVACRAEEDSDDAFPLAVLPSVTDAIITISCNTKSETVLTMRGRAYLPSKVERCGSLAL
jgi:hypothetical protein